MEDVESVFNQLHEIFIAVEAEGKLGLNIDEFKTAMRKTVGRNSTEEEIELLFLKADANCDGIVEWYEYVRYNLLDFKLKARMLDIMRDKPFSNEVRDIHCQHRDLIVRILFYPHVKQSGFCGVINNKSGKYMSLSKEGLIGIWNVGMKSLGYHNANAYLNRNTQPWFTDMVAMYNVNMLALTSSDRDIIIFDLTGKTFKKRYHLTGFENSITAMDYWTNPKDMNYARLLLGDTSGSIYCIKFESALRGGPFGAIVDKKKECKRISLIELLRGFILGVKAQIIPKVHDDWVNKVLYLPEIDSFLSSCQRNQTALFFGDLPGIKRHVYFKINKGVICFDYSNVLNVIVTGGMDYIIRVWNPYAESKELMLLKGHNKPISHVIIHDTKHQIISIDTGRSLRVYDMRDQTCLQQISARIIKFDQFRVSAVCFNAALNTTLLAANHIVMLERRCDEEHYSGVLTHNQPVVAAIYNKVFDVVVSACRDSVVSVWDTNTGDKLMQFVNAHSVVEQGVTIPVEITTLCFDRNGKRLITGARNGTVHVWNFNSGNLLQAFTIPDNSNITGIVCTRHHIYITGWCKKVYSYHDIGNKEDRKEWLIHHKEDILCISYLSPNIIVTGSYDGDLVIWTRATGQVYCRLNAFESSKPLCQNKSIKFGADLGCREHIENTEHVNDMKQTSGQDANKTKLFLATCALQDKLNGSNSDLDQTLKSITNEKCEHPLLQALDPNCVKAVEETNYSRDDYDHICKHYESAVENIIFLETREPLQKDVAVIVVSGAEGWIRFWSMHNEGGLLGQFNAAHKQGESVLAIKSDTFDHFLFTGDTQGYIKIWDIQDYCVSNRMNLYEKEIHYDNLRKKFTFFRIEMYGKKKTSIPEHLKRVYSNRPPPSSSDPQKTLRYPSLVNSFRAHIRSIHSVDYVTERELIISASADCSVRLWTLNGQYIGTFGGESWQQLPQVVTNEYFLPQIPYEIRRVASAQTLKVLHSGDTPRWNNAIGIIRNRGIERLKKQFEHLVTEEHKDDSKNTEDEVQSNILGKSYKSTTRHRMPLRLPKFVETPVSCAVYHTLPFAELTAIDGFKQAMEEVEVRRAGFLMLNKIRGVEGRKTEAPALFNVYKKLMNKPNQHVRHYFTAVNRIKKVQEKYQNPRTQEVISK